MRVLHVIPSLSLTQGGPSFALPVMERALTAAGIDVETVTTDDDGPGRHISKRMAEPIEENGVTRRYFPKQTEFYKVSLPLYRWMRREVRRFDVVHVHAVFSFASVAAAWACARAKVPYVIRPLGLLNSYGMTQRRAILKSLSMRMIEGPLLRDAAAVHFTSEAEQREAESLGWSIRSVVIPLGIETFDLPSRDVFLSLHPDLRDRRRILFLSRLDPKKNVETLLEAFAQIRAERGDTALIICGDGNREYTVRLKDLAERLNIVRSVVWAGSVEGQVKRSALACADLFVLPSFSENFGIAAAEALFSGLPCVLSHGVAIAAEVAAAKAGLAINPSSGELAKAIRFYLDDDDARLAAGMNAKRLAEEKYSAAAMGERLVQLYRDAAQPSRTKNDAAPGRLEVCTRGKDAPAHPRADRQEA